MTLRARIALAEGLGVSPLAARLALLDSLALAEDRERDYIAGHCAGLLRVRKQAESHDWWRDFRDLLWWDLQRRDTAMALARLDAAVDRVEPAGDGVARSSGLVKRQRRAGEPPPPSAFGLQPSAGGRHG